MNEYIILGLGICFGFVMALLIESTRWNNYMIEMGYYKVLIVKQRKKREGYSK